MRDSVEETEYFHELFAHYVEASSEWRFSGKDLMDRSPATPETQKSSPPAICMNG